MWTAFLLVAVALAQDGFDAHGLDIAPSDGDALDPLVTWRPEAQVPGSVGIGLVGEYATGLLVLHESVNGGPVTDRPLLDDVVALNLGVHAAVHERIALAIDFPLFLASQGESGSNGFAVGDLSLYAPVGLLLPKGGATSPEEGFGLSVVPFFTAPTGDQDAFLGQQGVAGGGLLAAGFRTGPFAAAVDAGYRLAPSVSYENIEGGGRILARASVGLSPMQNLGFTVEGKLDAPSKSNSVAGSESQAELLASGRFRSDMGLSVLLGGAAGLASGAGTADFRLFLGLGYTFGKPFGDDRDGDGFADSVDQCPDEPEIVNGLLDDDGCPDSPSTLTLEVKNSLGDPVEGARITVDGDLIGVTDEFGQLAMSRFAPGSTHALQVEGADGSGLGVATVEALEIPQGKTDRPIELPWLPGSVRVEARTPAGPVTQAQVTLLGPTSLPETRLGSDGKKVFVLPPGEWVVLVSSAYFGTERRDITVKPGQDQLLQVDVVLYPAQVQVTKTEVVLLENVQFGFDSTEVEQASVSVIEEVGNNLLTHPDIKLVEIQGHTDSEGKPDYNLELSQRRMDGVVARLIAMGVSPDRLLAVGYGEACPLESNNTEQGRSANRRVQFIIADPLPTGGVPCRDGAPARKAQPREVEAPAQP